MLTQPCPAIFAILPKTLPCLQAEAESLSVARAKYEAFVNRSNAERLSEAHPLPYGPISVAAWLLILSPEQMARYAFTAYNCLLSLTALETIQNHDFATEGAFGREMDTYENLREAMRQGYEQGTVDIRCWGGQLSLEFYVPGGGLTHWPAHISKPATGFRAHESEPGGDDDLAGAGDAVPYTDEELADQHPDDEDDINPANELAYEHLS